MSGHSNATLADRLQGGLIGLLVGDALGVPYEFTPPQRLPPRASIDMTPPAHWPCTHDVPPGTWSDDGAQALCLLDSLLAHETLDLDDFAQRLLRWYREGYLQAGGRVFDIGLQTRQALRRLEWGEPAHEAGPAGEHQNGNGALMRVLPLALLHDPQRQSRTGLIDAAQRQSLVTHGHPRSRLCCALYCLWAVELLAGLDSESAWNRAADRLRAWCEGADDARRFATWSADQNEECSRILDASNADNAKGSGYVLDTLWSARACLHHPDYADAVRAAVALGHDTDTTSAVTGGLAGLRSGINGIPARWRETLRDAHLFRPLLDQLRRRRSLP
ncbi:MAG TPA: ADP-ribosylglycohydrolase family protein [Xanthomonadaceae bacterium]|nr:ADP-ribosylglycohydrolase family protein [Xanthomonadaceae bacterium]